MKYTAIEEERKWWEKGGSIEGKPISFPARHRFAHSCIRSNLCDALVGLGCNNTSSILDAGCGSGEDAIYIQKVSKNIIGVDISQVALKRFAVNGFQSILANVKNLPFHSESFDYVVCSGLLHHLVGQGDLVGPLREFVRVTKKGGYVVVLEPNAFHLSGILMNIFNTINPGITGLVPHERALSPLHLTKIFMNAGLKEVNCISASYVWNRFPLPVSKFISSHEDRIRFKKPFSLFGWLVIVAGKRQM